jgi:hypothetical protein
LVKIDCERGISLKYEHLSQDAWYKLIQQMYWARMIDDEEEDTNDEDDDEEDK